MPDADPQSGLPPKAVCEECSEPATRKVVTCKRGAGLFCDWHPATDACSECGAVWTFVHGGGCPVCKPSRRQYGLRDAHEWKPGDLVTWDYAPSDCLGYTVPIPCHFAASECGGRAIVYCLRADGTWTDGRLVPLKELRHGH